ncbi:hypothetical protein N7492_006877 [Penicillium capsulatum]|uniref:Uncharacterized protein n=1 Tax=Penicillium capsulatum TaxID=69766 RepID=A0A9W9I3U5_9EURO|nr:hypothetical protein N7492_006877 [Penicillium capsulatum]KAJ6116711.1 hypothetical protein N7512_006436 [Penicillium capsulatum]
MKPTTTTTVEERLSQAQIASDDDPTSSSGSSSLESESEDESSDDESAGPSREHQGTNSTDDSAIPNVTGRQKPHIHRMEGSSGLLARLSEFMPKIKDANDNLEKEIAAGRGKDLMLDSVEEGDGKDYIEMNLGLGVLEEKRNGDEDPSSNVTGAQGSSKLETSGGDSDLLGKLMGEDESGEKPSIEEMAE